jgi:caa(3)-type oxidase subunit IV
MAVQHDTPDHHGPTIRAYLVVFGALCGFTLISFVANYFATVAHTITPKTSMAIIMAVAVCKATLVCMYFMHLKFEWGQLYFLIVPVGILAVMMMIVLMPDIVVGPQDDNASTAAAAQAEKQ